MGIGIEDVAQRCLECGKECSSRRSLGNHVARSHKGLGGLLGYVTKHVILGVVPVCSCGCDQPVEWKKTRYKFNDFVNGHNHRFSSDNQPSLTQQQIEKRNESIRRVYEERGVDISRKISVAVKRALANSDRDISDYFKKKWNDPAFRNAQHRARLESWRDEAGAARRHRVFTPEFGLKISKRNLERAPLAISKSETKFVQFLRSIFGDLDVEAQKNIVLPGSSKVGWRADAYIKSKNAIVEFDGIFYHGLDRHHGFTSMQIFNMANDICKNVAAIENSFTLVRIAESVDLSGVRSWDDLLSLAYHVVFRGRVIRDGGFSMRHLGGELVSRKAVMRAMAQGFDVGRVKRNLGLLRRALSKRRELARVARLSV